MSLLSAVASLYPLPLTPLEHYMFLDDRPAQPMTYAGRFVFDGVVDREAMDKAVEEALAEQSLLNAIVDTGSSRIPQWLPAPETRRSISWLDSPESIAQHGDYRIDLRREPGVRFWGAQGDNSFELFALFHHACCDGIGAMRFLGDLLARYGRHCGMTIPVVALDHHRLVTRGDSRWIVHEDEHVGLIEELRNLASEVYQFFFQKPKPLAGSTKNPVAAAFPAQYHRTVDAGKCAALRKVAARHDATLNDLLMRDMFLVLDQWSRQHDNGYGSDWLRINMPTNLRTSDDQNMPAANVMSYMFLTHRASLCRHPDLLLERIQRTTKWIKHWNLGMYFLDALANMRRIPGGMWFVTRPCCYATATFSNIGDPTWHFNSALPQKDGRVHVGGLTLRHVLFSPPSRPLTRCGMVACLEGKSLTMTARCDPECFSSQDVQALLDSYIRQLGKSIGGTVCSESETHS